MTDDGGGLLWDNQSWANFLNFDNLGGDGTSTCNDEKSGNKLGDDMTILDSHQTPSINEEINIANKVVADQEKKESSSDIKGKKNKKGKNKNMVTTNEGKSGGGGGGGSDDHESSDHEIHIWTERERRKKMRTMFSNLHALLPQLPPKVYTYFV